MRTLLKLLLLNLFLCGVCYAPPLKPFRGAVLPHGRLSSRGLVAAWFFNEGGSTTHAGGNIINDLSGNGNNGICVRANNMYWTPGRDGWAMYVDSSSERIDVGNKFALANITFKYTLETIIYLDALVNYNGIFIRAPAYNSTSSQIELYGYANGNLIITHNRAGTMGSKTFTGVMSAGQRLHLIIVWDGSDWQLYINGILKSGSTTGSIVDPATGDTSFLMTGYTQSSLNGKMSLFRCYNRALNASEIAELYREPFIMSRIYWNWGVFGTISVVTDVYSGRGIGRGVGRGLVR